jgi:hypothetical protein
MISCRRLFIKRHKKVKAMARQRQRVNVPERLSLKERTPEGRVSWLFDLFPLYLQLSMI